VKLIVGFRNFANSSNNDAKAEVPVLSPPNVCYTYEHLLLTYSMGQSSS